MQNYDCNYNYSYRHWIEAIRPKTLTAAIAPVILGATLALVEIKDRVNFTSVVIIIITLITALLLQITTNLINDYYDFLSGVDGDDRLGPKRVTQSGLIAAEKVKRAFSITIALSLFLGMILVAAQGGIVILIIGVLSIVFAWAYTAGPIPLSHIALGELLALIFFGPVAVAGTYYLITQKFNFSVILCGLGVGSISSAIMAINNIRDLNSDINKGKKTLAVIFGEKFGRVLPIFFVIISFLIPIIYFLATSSSVRSYIIILSMFCLLLYFKDIWRGILKDPIDCRFNNFLACTGKYLFFYSILFSIGVIIV
ncbi:MAG: 1,4-dihydroxy-2-naphthoate octaprenyltransferase [Oligoflexia bacterium]|nr:1,4-dihydroxy-2-naphthoate octaprenyltransferase [Oligoflexia bacterium]